MLGTYRARSSPTSSSSWFQAVEEIRRAVPLPKIVLEVQSANNDNNNDSVSSFSPTARRLRALYPLQWLHGLCPLAR